MAQKRMFDKAIIDTDKFMDLPVSAKALYFLLGMEADDEGFVSYRKVLRVHGGTNDDIKILQAKKFVLMFESGVVVITDWKKNNYLDKNRMKETEYQEEKKLLAVQRGKYKMLNECLTDVKPEERRGEEKRVEESNTNVQQSLDECTDFINFYNSYPRKEGKGQARRAFNTAKKKVSLEKMLASLEKHKKKWQDPKYIPLPATWLNGERWDDEIKDKIIQKNNFISL
jgi:hypothetical protein